MKKNSIILLSLLASLNFVKAQNITSKKWTDLFSYNNVLAMKEDNGRIVAATQNGIFFYNMSSGEISKLSKANGLHEVKISAFDYNPETKIGLVGYNSGALDLITPEGITYVVDIPIATGYTGSKKINHISINGNKAVVSVGYGVSIYNLTKKEFGDTCFFGNTGIYEASNEAVILGNTVFSATSSGIKSSELTNTFPIFSSWNNLMTGNFTQASAKGNAIFSTSTQAYLYNTGTLTPIPQSFGNISDLVFNANDIVVTDDTTIHTFSTTGMLTSSVSVGEHSNTASSFNGKLYVGTKFNGIVDQDRKSYKPDGPYFNDSYKINLLNNNQFLVSTGGRSDQFNGSITNPNNPGFYYFNGAKWLYSTFFSNNPDNNVFNVLDAVKNPHNENEVFFTNYVSGSFSNGIYKLKLNSSGDDFEFVKKYVPTEVSPDWHWWPVGFAKDDQNNLFVTISQANTPISYYGVGVFDKAADQFKTNYTAIKSSGAQKPIYHDNLLWLALPRANFFAAYDYKNTATNISDDEIFEIGESNGLPSVSTGTVSFAIDKEGDGWIGTDNGLRVLRNASGSIKNNPSVEPIVIQQNGLAEELFKDTGILQIEVDAGNNKWVSTDGGGVYYLSSDGEKTIKHFTKENSPLPTNAVTDIKVDPASGKVFFVTYDGIVVYQGDVGEVNSGFGKVVVYPNPVVYSNFKGKVTIKGLAEKTNIRITDAAGNLVHSAVARGGYYEWDLNNQRNQRVASGIYFVLMTNEDGSDKATAKIAVVN